MQICFASHNQNKVKEINTILPPQMEVVGLNDIGVTEDIAETGKTLSENSIIKASYVFERFKMPVFADDSGLLVRALNDAPGVYSARYAGEQKDDEQNMRLLLKNMEGISDRSAAFQTVITYIDQDARQEQFVGEVCGQITHNKQGEKGFGYDPIFMPDGYEITFGEFELSEKNKISHRAIAVKKFIDFLQKTHG